MVMQRRRGEELQIELAQAKEQAEELAKERYVTSALGSGRSTVERADGGNARRWKR